MSDLTAGLTGTEASVLLVLASVAGPVRNPDLKELGPALEAPSRAKLTRRGLLEVTDGPRRSKVLSLTDRGWAAAAELMESAPPARSTPSTRALFTLAGGLGRYLRRESLALGEVLLPATGASGAVTGETIRAAYQRAAPRPGAWLTLRELRANLPDLPRDAVDAALRELYPEPGVDIVAEDNLKALTADDRAAALILGGRELHAIRVTR